MVVYTLAGDSNIQYILSLRPHLGQALLGNQEVGIALHSLECHLQGFKLISPEEYDDLLH
jgi:hypothetical protein